MHRLAKIGRTIHFSGKCHCVRLIALEKSRLHLRTGTSLRTYAREVCIPIRPYESALGKRTRILRVSVFDPLFERLHEKSAPLPSSRLRPKLFEKSTCVDDDMFQWAWCLMKSVLSPESQFHHSCLARVSSSREGESGVSLPWTRSSASSAASASSSLKVSPASRSPQARIWRSLRRRSRVVVPFHPMGRW